MYWTGGNYIGLGPSAASHVEGLAVEESPAPGRMGARRRRRRPARDGCRALTPEQRTGELAMLKLRLTRGLDFADFAARTGRDVREAVLGRAGPTRAGWAAGRHP